MISIIMVRRISNRMGSLDIGGGVILGLVGVVGISALLCGMGKFQAESRLEDIKFRKELEEGVKQYEQIDRCYDVLVQGLNGEIKRRSLSNVQIAKEWGVTNDIDPLSFQVNCVGRGLGSLEFVSIYFGPDKKGESYRWSYEQGTNWLAKSRTEPSS